MLQVAKERANAAEFVLLIKFTQTIIWCWLVIGSRAGSNCDMTLAAVLTHSGPGKDRPEHFARATGPAIKACEGRSRVTDLGTSKYSRVRLFTVARTRFNKMCIMPTVHQWYNHLIFTGGRLQLKRAGEEGWAQHWEMAVRQSQQASANDLSVLNSESSISGLRKGVC